MVNMTFKEFIEKVKARREKALANKGNVNALTFFKFFPEWNAGVTYAAGNIVRHNDMLYRVLADHVSEIGMEPGECDKFKQVMA